MDFKDIPKIIERISSEDGLHASYKGEDVSIGIPFETDDKSKALAVYANTPNGDVALVRFMDRDFSERTQDPRYIHDMKENFKCDLDQDISTPSYWMCKILSLDMPFADKKFEHKVFFDYASKTIKSVRDGVQEYMGVEIGMEPLDKVFTIYRRPETVTAIAGVLKGLPLIEDHIDPTDEPAKETINGVIDSTEIIEYNDGFKDSTLYLKNTVNLNEKGLSALSRGKRHLSLGYLGKLKPHDQYDFEQYDLVPTHLAIVDNARGGDILAFEDKNKNKDKNMKIIFTDEDGKISLQKVAEMAGTLQDALKNAPLEEIVAIMPTLQALVESAKSNDPSLQVEEASEDMGDHPVMDGKLSDSLNAAIEKMVTDDKSRADIVKDIASEAGIEEDTVNGILSGDIKNPPPERVAGIAKVLGVSEESVESLTPEEEEKPMEDADKEDDDDKEEKFEDSQKFKDAVNSIVSEKLNTIEKAKEFLPETYNFVDSSTSEIMKAAVEKETGKTFEDSEIPIAFKMLKKQSSQYKTFGDDAKDAWDKIKTKEI